MKVADVRKIFKRRPDSNKGNYGHVFVLAGSVGLTGASYLTSQAALLSGSGLVTLGIPRTLNPILARKLVEVMTLPLAETRGQSLSLRAFPEIQNFCSKIDVLAVGPGLSQNKETQSLVRKIISRIRLPMVIDADGLNALAGHTDILSNTSKQEHAAILTPHLGEMARLTGRSIEFIQRNRKKVAQGFAKKHNVILVLKGHHTIVADPSGKTYINNTGNPGMASAGVGDVLTGIIASFLGQGLSAFDAAKLGVYIHGMAGDVAAQEVGQVSLTATDLLNKLPEVLRLFSASARAAA